MPAKDDRDATTSTDATSGEPGTADSPKRQGDKLAVAGGPASPTAASEAARAGDSPKRQGDALEHAVAEAAKR